MFVAELYLFRQEAHTFLLVSRVAVVLFDIFRIKSSNKMRFVREFFKSEPKFFIFIMHYKSSVQLFTSNKVLVILTKKMSNTSIF